MLVRAVLVMVILVVVPAMGATSSVHVTKLANAGSTVIAEKTLDYHWMEQHLQVLGDGVTHYYLQGPVFNATTPGERWNPAENDNVLPKDMGAVKGSDVKDLCDQVGGMGPEDTLKVIAADGFSKIFPYRNIYEPDARQGPVILSWYRAEEGYVPSYSTGMRIIFLADDSVNPYGVHAFGNWDEHETLDEPYRHYYYQGSEKYPTTTGLSVQNVAELKILSSEPPPEPPAASFSVSPRSGQSPLTVTFTDTSSGSPRTWNWTFGDGGRSSLQNPIHTYSSAGEYIITLGIANPAGSSSVSDTVSVGSGSISYEEQVTSPFPDNDSSPDLTETVDSSGNTAPSGVEKGSGQDVKKGYTDPLEILRERSHPRMTPTVTLVPLHHATESPLPTELPVSPEPEIHETLKGDSNAPGPGPAAHPTLSAPMSLIDRVLDLIDHLFSVFG